MVKDWISAARPRTLPASASPVIAASAYAFYAGTFRWVPAVLCLLFALLAQVASNMANDYFDYVKGSDKAGRVGPRRAVASGDITPRAMLMGTFCVLGVACAVGLGLVFFCRLAVDTDRRDYSVVCISLYGRPLSVGLSRIGRCNRVFVFRSGRSKHDLLCTGFTVRCRCVSAVDCYGIVVYKYSVGE